ncbi:hypothetical protein BTM29_06255 [Companilactobacillus allii]|uniref:Inosine/uridine-preferring nucleoside hydrolase domain-containing protein n=2 Tax=Companilactobacillus allii TaxID=1847728 RepID=A0A1P8Q2X5_9LACO|nr:hypothetical protein BTM29_06255 [Companilactobacillus allii]
MKLIYDCDNTIGLHGKDVDDGLTLLYLYQQSNIDILGVTLTYGNGTVQEVKEQTEQLCSLFSLDVDTYVGKGKDDSDVSVSMAAKFLVKMVKKYPHQIVVLATGSMANLYEAYKIEPSFFKLLKKVVIMGGRFEEMFINSIPIGELNLSIAPEAAHAVITSEIPMTIVSGQYISGALLGRDDLHMLDNDGSKRFKWLSGVILDWMQYTEDNWSVPGFINWDTITALSLTEPDQFEFEDVYLSSSVEGLKTGLMEKKQNGNQKVEILTSIKDLSHLNNIVLKTLNNYFIEGN